MGFLGCLSVVFAFLVENGAANQEEGLGRGRRRSGEGRVMAGVGEGVGLD